MATSCYCCVVIGHLITPHAIIRITAPHYVIVITARFEWTADWPLCSQ